MFVGHDVATNLVMTPAVGYRGSAARSTFFLVLTKNSLDIIFFKGIIHAKMTVSDSQHYPLNLYLINNKEMYFSSFYFYNSLEMLKSLL